MPRFFPVGLCTDNRLYFVRAVSDHGTIEPAEWDMPSFANQAGGALRAVSVRIVRLTIYSELKRKLWSLGGYGGQPRTRLDHR
jgi:hypothetical protein